MSNTHAITLTFADRETAQAYKAAMLEIGSMLQAEMMHSPDSWVAKKSDRLALDTYADGMFKAIGNAMFFSKNEPVTLTEKQKAQLEADRLETLASYERDVKRGFTID